MQTLAEKRYPVNMSWMDPRKVYASNLPFCLVRFVQDNLLRPQQYSTFMSDYYQEQGKAVHKAVQKNMALAGLLYGDWKCWRCRKEWRGKTSSEISLRCCGQDIAYQELKLIRPVVPHRLATRVIPAGVLTMKCDGLLTTGGENEFVVLEIKLIGDDEITTITEPHWSHGMQASMYAASFQKLGFRIPFVWILYISRNKHTRTKSFFLTRFFDYTDSILQEYGEALDRMAGCNWKGVDAHKVCASRADSPYCQYLSTCFGKHSVEDCFSRQFTAAEISL